MKMCSWIL